MTLTRPMSMLVPLTLLVFGSIVAASAMQLETSGHQAIDVVPDDTFSFRRSVLSVDSSAGNTYGPADWGLIHCGNVSTCAGYPTNWKMLNHVIPYNEAINTCADCKRKSAHGNCTAHRQSPIALLKNVTMHRACRDRHLMKFQIGNCRVEELDFQILPHVLRAHQPHCSSWPTIDFSLGFPDPWLLQFTDVTIPSQHTIDGRRYSAEVILSHTYSQSIADKLIGNVAVLVDVGDESEFYGFFELYLRGWEKTASKIASDCARRRGLVTPAVDSDFREQRLLVDDFQYVNQSFYKGRYHPYMFYKDTGTEFYFRYQGSVIEPPCLDFGVHWRVLRLPIKISVSQFERLKLLFQQRLNPSTCQRESAARSPGGKPAVNRPLQSTTPAHKLVYCECLNWVSRKPHDISYCNQTMQERGVFNFTPMTKP